MPGLEKNIRALIRILSEDRRSILAVYYDTIVTATNVERIIDQAFPEIKKKRIHLSQYSQEEIIPLLRKQIQQSDAHFVYIYDLEHAGFVYSHERQTYVPTQFLSMINLQREKFFANSTGKIIFFVKKAFVQQIRQSMADFWDWIFYHFEFNQEDFKRPEINIPQAKDISNGQISKDSIRTLEKEIKQLLRDKQADPQALLMKLTTLIDYYISEGKATYATEWINKASRIAIQLRRYDLVAMLYEKLANYYIDRGHWKKAEKYLTQAMEVRRKHLSAKQKELGDLFNKLGYISKMLGNLDKAREYYTRVAKEQMNQEKILDLAQSYCDLAKVFMKTHEYNKALGYALHSVDLRKKVLPRDSIILARNYYQLAQIYSHLKKPELAKKYLDKARCALSKAGRDKDAKLAQNIESLYQSLRSK